MRMRGAFIKRMFVVVLVLFWFAAPPVHCQQDPAAPGEALTLDEAIAITLRDNRSIKNARLGVEKSEDHLAAQRTARFPNSG